MTKWFPMVLALGLALGCKSKGVLQSPDQLRLNLALSVVSGDAQIGTPRQELAQQIVFQVIDRQTSKPQPDTELRFCLAEPPEGEGSNLTPREMVARCESSTSSAHNETDSPGTAPAQKPEQAQIATIVSAASRTDKQGMASVTIRSPAAYGQSLMLVAYIPDASGPVAGASARFSTLSLSDSNLFLIAPTSDLVTAGDGFELLISAIDRDGFLAVDFATPREFTLSHAIKPSWAGRLSRLPVERFTCVFAGGKCTVPGGPWMIMPAGSTTLQLLEHSSLVTSDATINVASGPGAEVVIGSRVARPDDDASLVPSLVSNIGDDNPLSAFVIDRGGNRIRFAYDAIWSISNPDLAASLPQGPAGTISFTSTKAGKGDLSAATPDTYPNPIEVRIRPGDLASWFIKTEHNNTEVAGECFAITIEARDRNGNLVNDLEGPWDLVASIEGVTESGPAVADTAHFEVSQRAFGRSLPTTVTLTGGVGRLSPLACLYDASEVAPTIVVSGETKAETPITVRGETSVTVRQGKPAGISLSTAAYGMPGSNPCLAPASNVAEEACIVLSTDDRDLKFYTQVTDRGGNPLGATSASWRVTGPLATSLNGKTFAVFAPIHPTLIGSGTMELSSPQGFTRAFTYSVKHGAPARFRLASENTGIERATTPFAVVVTAYDQYDNFCDTFVGGISLNFALDGARISPDPERAPVSAPFTELVQFTNGRGETVGKLQAPYATQQPGQAMVDKPRIKTEQLGGESFYSEGLTILAGPSARGSFRSAANGTGIPVTAPLGIRQDRGLALYLASYDAFGNYAGEISASFSTTGALLDTLSVIEGTATTIVPKDTGVGAITATPSNPAIASFSLDPITVTASRATRLELLTTNNQREVAGEPFTIKIRALDRDGNISTDYQGEKTLNFEPITATSWGGQEAVLPKDNYVCLFEMGVCTLRSASGDPLQFVVTDWRFKYLTALRDVGEEISGVFAQMITVTRGVPAKLILTDKLGGPDAGAKPMLLPVAITADDMITIATALVDAGGNYLGDAPATTTWTNELTPLPAGRDIFAGNLGTGVGSSVQFIPTISGNGALAAHSGDGLSSLALSFTVAHGQLHGMRIVTEHGDAGEQAGQPFTFGLVAIDAKGNTFESLDGSYMLSMRIVDSISGPTTLGIGRFIGEELSATGVKTKVIGPIQLRGGQFEKGILSIMSDDTGSALKIALLDATDVAPKLSIQVYEGIVLKLNTLTNPISVHKGPAHHIALMLGPGDSGDFLCEQDMLIHAYTNFIGPTAGYLSWDNSGERTYFTTGFEGDFLAPISKNTTERSYPDLACTTFVTDDGPKTVYAVVHDAGGNYLQDASGQWSINNRGNQRATKIDLLKQNLEPSADGKSVVLKNTVSAIQRFDGIMGVESFLTALQLKFNSTNPPNLSVSNPIHLASGVPHSFEIDTENISADQGAWIEILFLDQFGNQIVYWNSGPDANAPGMHSHNNRYLEVPNLSYLANFSWMSEFVPSPSRTGTFPLLPYRPGQTAKCSLDELPCRYSTRLPRAYETVGIEASIPGLGSNNIVRTVAPGKPVGLDLYLTTGAQAVAVSDGLNISADHEFKFFPGGYDLEENYVGPLSVNAVGTGSLSQSIPGGMNSTISVLPTTAGTGTVTATTLSLDRASTWSSTVQLTIVPGIPAKLAVEGLSTATIVAGTTQDLIIKILDKNNNIVTSQNGQKSIMVSLFTAGLNKENKSFAMTANGVTYKPAVSLVSDHMSVSFPVSFAAGVSTTPISITMFTKTPANKLVFVAGGIDSFNLSRLFNGETLPEVPSKLVGPIAILANSPHHYGVLASGSTSTEITTLPPGTYSNPVWATNYSPRADAQTKLSVTVQLRDAYGNPVDGGGEAGVRLRMLKSDGTPALGNLGGSTSNLDLSSGTASITEVSWDAAGLFILVAEKPGGGLYTTPYSSNSLSTTMISATPSLATISRYKIESSNTLTAGVTTIFSLSAVDNVGSPIEGLDYLLTPMSHTFSGFSPAPNGTQPSYTRGNFGGGTAVVTLTPYKAEVIPAGSLTVQENNQPSGRVGASTTALTVRANSVFRYILESSTTITSADKFGLFDVTISSYDQWMNPAFGSLTTLVAERVSGAQDTAGFYGPNVSNLDLSNSTRTTLTGLSYRVGQTIRLRLLGQFGVIVESPELTFIPTLHTVTRYRLSLPSVVSAGADNLPITMRALDIAGNTISGIDAALNQQVYTWSGATSQLPLWPPRYGSVVFHDGVANVVHSLYEAQVFESESLLVRDNYVPQRLGKNIASLTVSPASAAKLEMRAHPVGSTNLLDRGNYLAGTDFDLSVTALDNFGNVDTSVSSANLSFTWNNATAVPDPSSPLTLERGATASTPRTASAGTMTFQAGVWKSSNGPFTLFNAYNSNVSLSLTSSLNLPSSPLSFTVLPKAAMHTLLVQADNTYTSEVYASALPAKTADHDEFLLYAHGYDQYGNWKRLQTVDWRGTGAALSRVTPSVLAPSNASNFTRLTPYDVGSGTLSVYQAGSTTNLLAQLSWQVTSGTPMSYAVRLDGSNPASVQANSPFGLVITALDRRGNTATAYGGSKTLSFPNTMTDTVAVAPTAGCSKVVPSTGPVSFTDGMATLAAAFRAVNTADQFTISVAGDLMAGATTARTVTAGSPSGLSLTVNNSLTTASVTAGNGFGATLAVRDACSNIVPTATGSFKFAVANANPALEGGQTAVTPDQGAMVMSGSHNGVVQSGATDFILYRMTGSSPYDNAASLTASCHTGCSLGTSNSVALTVAPNAYDHIYLHSTGTGSPAPAGRLQNTISSLQAHLTSRFYAWAYDRYGNVIGLQSVNWSKGTVTNATIAPPSGSSTVLTPGNFSSSPPLSLGSETLTATPATGVPVTITIPIVVGITSKLFVEAPASVAANADFSVTLYGQDSRSNQTNDYSGGKAVTFTLTGANATLAQPTACTPTVPFPNPVSVSFPAAGANSISESISGFKAVKAGDSFTVTATAGSVSGTSSAISVTPGAGSALWLTVPNHQSLTAGTLFGVNVQIRDACSNLATAATGSVNFVLAGASSSLEPLTNPWAPKTPTDGPVSIGTGGTVTTGAEFALYKRSGTGYDTNITLKATCAADCSYTESAAIPLTVNPATADHIYVQTTGTGLPLPASRLHDNVPALVAEQGNSKQYFAWSYDAYGNAIEQVSALWSKGAATNAVLVASADGKSATLTPGNYSINPPSIGTELITVDHENLKDTEFLQPISPGSATQFVILLDGSDPTSVTANVPFGIKIRALDAFNNLAVNYNGSPTLTFSDTITDAMGTCTKTRLSSSVVSFSNGEAILANAYKAVKSGESFTISVSGDNKPTATTTARTVIANTQTSKLWLTVNNGQAVTAGTSFSAKVEVKDACSNPTTQATGSLDFVLSGASTSFESPTPPQIPSAGSVSLSTNGMVTTASAFTLYTRTQSPYDTNVTLKATCNSCSFTESDPVALTVNPGSAHHIYAHSSSANYPLASERLQQTLPALVADQGNTKQYYAWSYDLYGNAIELVSVTWAKAGTTNANLSASSGTTTIVSPGNFSLSPTSTGTETITASHASLGSTSFFQPISFGTATQLAVTYPNGTTVNAGAGFPVMVTARDYFGNTAKNFGQTQTVTFSWQGSLLTPVSGTQAPQLMGAPRSTHTLQVAFSDGVYSTNSTDFRIYSSRANGAHVRAAIAGVSEGLGATLTVLPTTASSYEIKLAGTDPATVVANALFGVAINALDPFGNIATGYNISEELSFTDTITATAGTCNKLAPSAATVTFTNGQVSLLNQFRAVNTLNPFTITVAGTLNSATLTSRSVAADLATAKLWLTANNNTSITAGTSFPVTVQVKDACSNLATAATGSLNFNLTGAGSSLENVTAPQTPSAGAVSITSGGQLTTGNVFTLYKRTGTSYDSNVKLGVACNSCSYASSDLVTLNVNPGAAARVYVQASSADFPLPSERLQGTLTSSLVADQGNTRVYYAWSYDSYGNAIEKIAADWSTGGLTNASLSASTGQSVALAPQNYSLTPPSLGNETVTAAFPGLIAATFTQPITAGVAKSLSLAYPNGTTVTAGTGFPVRVTARDFYGNAATGFVGNKTLIFAWDGSNLSGSEGAAAPKIMGVTRSSHSQSVSFSAGEFTSNVSDFEIFSVQAVSPRITAAMADASLTEALGAVLAVNAGAASRYAIKLDGGDPASVTANTQFGVVITALDTAGNLATSYTGSKNLSFSTTLTDTIAVAPAGACPKTAPSAAIPANFASGVATLPNIFKAVNTANNVAITVTGDLTSSTTTTRTVTAGSPSALSLVINNSLTSASVVAGNGFAAALTVRDACSNIVPNATGRFKFVFANANSSLEAGQVPVKPGDGVLEMLASDHGTKASGATDFRLFRMTGPSPYDNAVSLTASCYEDYCSLGSSNAVALTVTPNSYDHIYLHSSGTGSPAPAARLQGTITSLQAHLTGTYYAWGYDQYGNVIGLQSVAWTKGTATNATIAPTSGTSTVLTPGAYAATGPSSLGEETLTATPTTGLAAGIKIPIIAGTTSQLWLETPSNVAANEDFSVKIYGRDSRNNQTSDYAGNKSVSFAYTGANATIANPTACQPVLPSNTISVAFPAAGIASVSGNIAGFKAAKAGDNMTITATIGSLTVTSSPIQVVPGSGSLLELVVNNGQTVTAGTPFGVYVQVKDACSNLATSATGALNFTLTGTGNSYEPTTNPFAPQIPENSAVSLGAGGTVTTGNIFTLYRRTGTNYDADIRLKASCANCPYSESSAVAVSVNPGAGHHIYAHSTASDFPRASQRLQAGSVSNLVANPGNSMQYYAWSYDQYGNAIEQIAVDWSTASLTTATLVASADRKSATLTPEMDSVNRSATGDEEVRATHATLVSTSFSQPIVAGTAVKYTVTLADPNLSSVTANIPFAIRVRALDAFNNIDLNYSGDRTLAWTNSIKATAGSCSKAEPSTTTVTFSNGQGVSAEVFKAVEAGDNFIVTATNSSITGTSASISVAPGAGSVLSLTVNNDQDVTAGTPFAVNVQVRDACSNIATSATGNLNFELTGASTSLEPVANPRAPQIPANGTVSLVTGGTVTTGNIFTLYKRSGSGYDSNITLKASCLQPSCSYTDSAVLPVTVKPASAHHIYAHASNANFPLPSNRLQNGSVPSLAANLGNNKQYFAWSYDEYGNAIEQVAATWNKGNVTNASLAASPDGKSATLTPGNYSISPSSLGDELITAQHNTLGSTEFIQPIIAGSATKFSILLDNNDPATVTANVPFGVKIRALDAFNNLAIDYTGNRTLAFSDTIPTTTMGLCTKLSPNSKTVSFSAGEAILDGEYKAVKSGESFTISVSGDSKPSATTTSRTVIANTATSKLWLTVNNGQSITAGTSFSAKVEVKDACSNPTTQATGSLEFVLAGASTSFESPTPPQIPSAGSVSLSANGMVTTASAFTLYKRTQTPYDTNVSLKVRCHNSCSFAESDLVALTVNPGEPHHIYAHSSNSNYPLASERLQGTLPALVADQGNGKQYYAWSYDQYGNAIGLVSVNWAKAGATDAVLSTSSGTSMTLSPANASQTAASLGNVTITATGTGLIETSFIQPITAGTATHLELSYPNGSTVTAGIGFPVRISAKDYYGNVATSYSGPQMIQFGWNGSNVTPLRGASAPSIMGATRMTHSTSGDFAAGIYTSASNDFKIYSARASNASISASISGLGDSTGPVLTITPATASNLALPTVAPVLTAGVQSNFEVFVVDAHGNDTTEGCDAADLTITCANEGACSSYASGNYGSTVGVQAPLFSVGALSQSGSYSVAATIFKASHTVINQVTGVPLNFSAACDEPLTLDQQAMTVQPNSSINAVVMTTTAATLPGPTDHLASVNCASSAATVTCPALYAYPYDAWGNFNGSSSAPSCPAWEFVDGNVAPFHVSPYTNVTGMNATGHSSGQVTRSYHMTGSVNCKVGGVIKGSTAFNLKAVEDRPYTLSCSTWSCQGLNPSDPPQASCTLTNTSGYDLGAVTVSPPDYGSITSNTCSGGVAGVSVSDTCNFIVIGAIGQASTGLGVTASVTTTGNQNTFATLAHPATIDINDGVVASACP